MRHLKPLLIFCLCLTMLATSAVGAFARGQMAFGQTLQICAEGEPLSITLDARGNPVNAAHPCPECLAVTAGLPPAAFEFTQPLGHWARLSVPNGSGVASQTTLHALARGPPALI
jgi:hypothetical protein